MADIIPITDLSAPELAVYTNMKDPVRRSAWERENALFIAESPKVIAVALDRGYEPVSLLSDARHIRGTAKDIIARLGDAPVYTADHAVLEGLTGFSLTRGVLCAMRRKKLPAAEELCALPGRRRVAVLESITDVTNVGAIFRSAAALGVDAVLLTPECCDPLSRRSIRVSMGTVFLVPWTRLASWPEGGMDMLRSLGYTTAALALSDEAISIDDPRLADTDRLALLLGTEGDGLSAKTIAGSDYTVTIPMQHGVDSLNVAAAGAVAFWELRKR